MAKNIIKLNRGDSYDFKISIPDKDNCDKNFILTGTDVVYFAVLYPHQRFEDAIIIKGYDHTDQLNNGEISIKIEPKDTVSLAPGIYYYTVKLHRGGTVGTLDDAEEAVSYTHLTLPTNVNV